MLGGIRHLIWDTGRGLDKVSIEIFAWATIIGSTVLTAARLDRRLLAEGRRLTMATPLAKARGLGSAHRGTETFWRQRLTAIANIPLVIFLILSIVTHIGADYRQFGPIWRSRSWPSPCSRS